MLINALYLDGDALASYIASAEGGLRRSGSARSKGGHGFGGSAGFSGARLEARSDSEDESTLNVDDHDAARLQRLIAAGRAEPEEHEWREVLEPGTEFPSTGTGALIDWECEVYVPESIAPVANQGEFKEAPGDLIGLTSDRRVASAPRSNLLSGSAIHFRPGAFPLGTDDNLFADQVVIIEDIVAEANGALAWGGHLTVPDQGLIYLASAPGAASSKKAASTFEEQDSFDSSAGAGTIDAFQPDRRRAAMAFARKKR